MCKYTKELLELLELYGDDTDPQKVTQLIVGRGRRNIKSIPKSFEDCVNLELIELHINEKTTKMPKINGLGKLKSFKMPGAKIGTIGEVKGLTSLETLDLSSNSIHDINGFCASTGLDSLVTLDLIFNDILAVNIIPDFTELDFLNLSHNRLTNLSFSKGLTKLRWLGVASNDILHIDDMCTNISYMDLNDNSVSINMAGLTKLVNIDQLHLKNTRVDGFPNIKDMHILSTLTFPKKYKLSNSLTTPKYLKETYGADIYEESYINKINLNKLVNRLNAAPDEATRYSCFIELKSFLDYYKTNKDKINEKTCSDIDNIINKQEGIEINVDI